MKPFDSLSPRQRALLDFLLIVIIGHVIKAVLDQLVWRYSGPIALAVTLPLFLAYLSRRGVSLAEVGLKGLRTRKQWLLLLPQTALAFFAIGGTGIACGLAIEALDIALLEAEPTRALMRFGDLEGNTPLYLSWLAILWFAGPAEELYFRGILITQLARGLNESRTAMVLSIVVPALVFGIGHIYYQGPRGLVTTGAIGLTLGVLFLAYRRNLWPLMIAHAAFNSLTFTAVYMAWDI